VVHESLLQTIWPAVAQALLRENVRLLCDSATLSALQSLAPLPPNLDSHVRASTPEDYGTEHGSLVLSVVTVPSLQSAIQFINFVFFKPHRFHCHRIRPGSVHFLPRGGLRRDVHQRQHSLCRRFPLRVRNGGGNQHGQDPCSWSGGSGGTCYL
jgi:hypothetical protein